MTRVPLQGAKETVEAACSLTCCDSSLCRARALLEKLFGHMGSKSNVGYKDPGPKESFHTGSAQATKSFMLILSATEFMSAPLADMRISSVGFQLPKALHCLTMIELIRWQCLQRLIEYHATQGEGEGADFV